MKAFRAFSGEVYKDGVLTVKEKEFVTLGIAIAVRCEGCIEAHVRNLVNLKATREEIAEVISVAVVMGGGPSTVYGGKALEAFDPFMGLFCTKVRMYCTFVSVLHLSLGPNLVVARSVRFVRPSEAPGM